MQSIKFDHGIWAVVHAAGRKYIGAINDLSWSGGTDEAEAILLNAMLMTKFTQKQAVLLDPAFEFHSGMIPTMTPRGPAMNHIVQVLPLDGATGPSKLRVIPDAVHLFSDMQERDLERHKNLVENFMEQIDMAARMAASNLVPATQIPGGGIGRSS